MTLKNSNAQIRWCRHKKSPPATYTQMSNIRINSRIGGSNCTFFFVLIDFFHDNHPNGSNKPPPPRQTYITFKLYTLSNNELVSCARQKKTYPKNTLALVARSMVFLLYGRSLLLQFSLWLKSHRTVNRNDVYLTMRLSFLVHRHKLCIVYE